MSYLPAWGGAAVMPGETKPVSDFPCVAWSSAGAGERGARQGAASDKPAASGGAGRAAAAAAAAAGEKAPAERAKGL